MSSARNAASAHSRAGGQRRAQRRLQSTCVASTISTLAFSRWCRSTAAAFRLVDARLQDRREIPALRRCIHRDLCVKPAIAWLERVPLESTCRVGKGAPRQRFRPGKISRAVPRVRVCAWAKSPLSVDPIADSSSVSTLIEENVRMLATPFLVAFSVLSKNNSKAHACPPIAVRAGHAKSQHSLAKLVTRSMPFRAGSDFDTCYRHGC